MRFPARCAAALIALAAGSAQAHARLESSDPAPSSTLAAAPAAIRLQFTEALEPAFSKIVLRDAAGNDIQLPKPVPDNASPAVLAVALPPLAGGGYRVQWTAVARDGHTTKGEFRFRVR
jgi:methionine-rich copper-binding protein CopC